MGVPAFFRWLSRKYPSIVVNCIEEKAKSVDEVSAPIDTSQPNPNGIEFDNLYLDMNGIIHPCCHPEDKPAPKNEDEMMVAIFEYIDRLFRIVRPRRLLYMAIDGVAPRAKMNQQRSRRFRASKEVVEKVVEIAKIRTELQAKGCHVPPEKKKEEHFDSNCITPGTPFMDRLAQCLHYYIHDRLNNDIGWRNIEVILSDANSPGEGEHKIMDYIRKQRANSEHDPNTHHCLCGADADLIMLGLATHEPNFTIIREEFTPNKPRPCELCNQIGHELKDCMGTPKDMQGEFDELPKPVGSEQEFIFLRLNVLREYLERELVMHNLPFEFDFERALDDWVFMCFFVGNDFLPHLPSLEIRENAIDRLIGLYKRAVYRTGGYLTDSGMVNLDRVQLIMSELGEVEDEIFKQRQQNELAFKRRIKEQKKRKKLNATRPSWTPTGQFAPVPIGSSPAAVENARKEAYQMRMQGNYGAAAALKAMMTSGDGEPGVGTGGQAVKGNNSDEPRGQKRKWDEAKVESSESEEEPQDDVRLWEDGWRDRYYENKFEVPKENLPFRHKVAAAYAEGLCWVLQYYYQGCPSWKWFFPYHYAPFASDFVNIGDLSNRFEKGTQPFKPLEQLMGVFPAGSKQHLPMPWAELMCDPDSPIIDFYPDDFRVDLNGKRYAWQGVALLPFVDERRLLKALSNVYSLLTADEARRNTRGDDRLYVSKRHDGYRFLLGLYEGSRDFAHDFQLDATKFRGVAGIVLLADNVVEPQGIVRSPVPGCTDIHNNAVTCVRYRNPVYSDDHLFPACRLPGAKEALRVLKPGNLSARDDRNWRPIIGMAPSTQRASLDIAGRRMLGHAIWSPDGPNRQQNSGQSQGQYSTVPPPQSGNFGQRGGGGGGGFHQRHGGGYGYDQRHQHYQQQQYHQQQQQQQHYRGGGGNNYRGGYGQQGQYQQNANSRGGGRGQDWRGRGNYHHQQQRYSY